MIRKLLITRAHTPTIESFMVRIGISEYTLSVPNRYRHLHLSSDTIIVEKGESVLAVVPCNPEDPTWTFDFDSIEEPPDPPTRRPILSQLRDEVQQREQLSVTINGELAILRSQNDNLTAETVRLQAEIDIIKGRLP